MPKERLTSRERVELALSHREADRIPRSDSFWPEVIPQWQKEGRAPAGDAIWDYFNFDIACAGWPNHQARPGYLETIQETDEWIARKDGNGVTLRLWKNKSGTPEHVAFDVNSREKWEEHKRTLLAVPIAQRVDLAGALRYMHDVRAKNRWFGWCGVECFEIAKDVTGHEMLCLAMADDPEWVKDIFDTETELVLRVYDYLEREGVQYDGAWIYGDIAFNTAPFFSPKMYRELIFPAHQRQIGWFKDRGMKVIYHTDGNFTPIIPSLLDAGVDCFQPLEAKAGMDVRTLKSQWGGRVAFMGNIDATVLLTNDRDKIEAEIAAKIPLAKKGGGYIYHTDHSVPPGVAWETYQFVLQCVDKYGQYD